MDPNLLVEALKLILSGDNSLIERGENIMKMAKDSDCYLKTLMIIANSSEVIFYFHLSSNFWIFQFALFELANF